MTFKITTKTNEKTFSDKELVNISSKKGYDFFVNFGFDFLLTVQYDSKTNTCSVLNPFNCDKFLFKGQPIGQKLDVEKMCKIMVKDSDEFITIKLVGNTGMVKISEENLTTQDLKELYGDDTKAAAKVKNETRRNELEQARVAIIKQVSYKINDLRHKLSMNSKTGIILHIALLAASIVLGFGVANYIVGLPLKEAGNIIQMPVNMKLVLLYSLIIYGGGLCLKQGMFLFFQNKSDVDTSNTNSVAQAFLIVLSTIFFASVYLINTLYYMQPAMQFFAILIPLFFGFTAVAIAIACGYYKSNNVELQKELNNYEYREDFEQVLKEYRKWIERFINTMNPAKIRNIKDKLFMLQLKSLGEIALGVCTAPFLAYGVSNTLAMCFPEAAGWVRISGLRFSPIFLTLATFLIIFAFFAFVNAFLCSRKIQASNVIKTDGFSNFIQHGVEIYGISGVRKLNSEMQKSFIIGICIIFIEFSMNISYFTQEMGQDLSGMFLSALAALVPTALLIAETYMLSSTKFEAFACDELIAKIDGE